MQPVSPALLSESRQACPWLQPRASAESDQALRVGQYYVHTDSANISFTAAPKPSFQAAPAWWLVRFVGMSSSASDGLAFCWLRAINRHLSHPTFLRSPVLSDLNASAYANTSFYFWPAAERDNLIRIFEFQIVDHGSGGTWALGVCQLVKSPWANMTVTSSKVFRIRSIICNADSFRMARS